MVAMTAEMRVPHGRGLGIPDARDFRLRLEDERLVLHRPGAAPQVLTSVPSVTAMVWLDPDETRRLLAPLGRRMLAGVARRVGGRGMRRELEKVDAADLAAAVPDDPESMSGAVVLLEGDRPVLALELAAFSVGAAEPAAAREQSGAVRLARALGLVLERAEAGTLDRAAVRNVLVAPWRPAGWWRLTSVLLCLAAAVVGFAAWPLPGMLDERWQGALTALAGVLLLPPVLAIAAGRRRFLALTRSVPDAEDREVLPVPDEEGSYGQLQLGPRDVVVVDPAGVEHWLPGPEAGGITSCELTDEVLLCSDAADNLVGPPLRTADVAPDAAAVDRLRLGLERAGIAFTDASGLPTLRGHGLPYALRYDDNWRHPVSERSWETGSLTLLTDYLALVAVLVAIPAVVATASREPWGWAAVLPWVACAVLRTWSGLALRRWRRGLVRRQAATTRGAT